jgi:hypothetical protein
MTMPTLSSALGIDGGAIFQIVAVESLGLGPRAIGIAFGMGTLSIPVQLAAARLPLWRARRNLQIYLTLAAVQCGVLATLVALDVAGETIAMVALGVTVVAEINVSVMYAPAWQPLVRFALTAEDRQRVNSRGRAAGGLVVAATLVLFGAASDGVRSLLLAAIGGVALALAATVRRLPAPSRPVQRRVESQAERRPLPRVMTSIYLALGLTGLAATWPLFLVYTREVLWPTMNLGVLGTIQLGGSLVAAVTWRTTRADPTPRAVRASVVLVTATLALAAVRVPVTSRAEQVATVLAFATAAACTATIIMALLERAHHEIDNDTSVKAFTILDVVASSSLQVGLLVGGFLVSASSRRAGWLLDPYRIYVVIGAITVSVALAALAGSRPGGRRQIPGVAQASPPSPA